MGIIILKKGLIFNHNYMGIGKELDYGNERTPSKPSSFIIVKPEGGRYLNELNETLNENGITINEVYFLDNWEEIARSIYEKQLKDSSESFYAGFESHVWLCQYLFGNHGLLLILDNDNMNLNIEEKTQIVHKARESFREKFPASNGMFTIAVNLDKIDRETQSGFGYKRGVLGIMQSDSHEPLIENESEGVWCRNYFKYIHAPENTEELIFQYEKLLDLKVMSEINKIGKNEWELLKFLRCLIPPSKYEVSDNP